jgi:hypothetical protein
MGIYKKYTEPMLNVMDIPYRVVNRSAEIKDAIKNCQLCMEAWLKPAAIPLTGGEKKRGQAVISFDAFENYGRNPSGFVTVTRNIISSV